VAEILVEQSVCGALALEPRIIAFAVVRPVAGVIAELGLRVDFAGSGCEENGIRGPG
jgi:hypothetical protein